jgi:GT2 family glycosyltransferase
VSSITQPAASQNAKSVLVVILNWNSPQETLAAVESVLRMDYPNYRLLVIDNGSTDNSADVLAQIDDPRVELVRSPENLGFTGGCNIGFETAIKNRADYVWLLNNDLVTEAGTLASLVRAAEQDPLIGLVSPLIASLQRPSSYIFAGGYFNPRTLAFATTRDRQLAEQWAREWPEQIMLLGTALLVSVDLVRKIGMMDASMFAYWEDTDFSARSNAAGFRNVIDFASAVYHSEKFPTDTPEEIKPHFWYYNARNGTRFWRKYAGPLSFLRQIIWSYRLQLSHLNMLKNAEVSRQAILSGMWDGWWNKGGPYRADRRMPWLVARIVEWHSRRQ